MNAISSALSAALIHFVWQGLAVAILVWAALFLLRGRSAELRYVVCCAALALLTILPIGTFWALYEQPAEAGLMAVRLQAAAPAFAPAPLSGRVDWLALAQMWALPVWSCGVLLFSVRMVWGCAQIAALRRAGGVAGPDLHSTIARLAERMGVAKPVRVLVSNVSDSPSVTGWLRPVILLPVAAIAGLTAEQLEAVLAHELAHIRRHDYLVNLLQMAAETLLFYHPAVWWLSSRIRHERELCCDDLAVRASGGALSYARALTELEKIRAPRPALALGSTDGPLYYRIRRLVAGGAESAPSKASGMIALALALSCLGLWVNWARAQEPVRTLALALKEGETHDDLGVTVQTAAPLLHRSGVEYPGTLWKNGIQGTVSLEATVDPEGQVIDARVSSGPNPLRRASLASVLNWHFVPGGPDTRTIQISFHRPSDSELAAAAITKDGPDGPISLELVNDHLKLSHNDVLIDSGRGLLVSAELKNGDLEKQKEKLQEDLDSAHLSLATLETAGNGNLSQAWELRKTISQLESEREKAKLSLEQHWKGLVLKSDRISPKPGVTGRKLSSIQINGLSGEFANVLQARLPIHQGDILTESSMESVTEAVRKFDAHLEVQFANEPEGVVLFISAPEK